MFLENRLQCMIFMRTQCESFPLADTVAMLQKLRSTTAKFL